MRGIDGLTLWRARKTQTAAMIGASLLWVGWFGFNGGSPLEAGDISALAFVNTLLATAAATVSWVFAEWIFKGKPSMLGGASGAVSGLVAITPACGFVGPMGALVIGLLTVLLLRYFHQRLVPFGPSTIVRVELTVHLANLRSVSPLRSAMSLLSSFKLRRTARAATAR